MTKLGLENKLIEELHQKLAEKDAVIAEQSAIIAEQAAQIKEKEKIILSFDTGKIVNSIDRYTVQNTDMLNRILAKMNEGEYVQFADYLMDELAKKDEIIVQIVRELNFLSLSATKKSEKYVPRDENGLAKGQTIDKKDPSIKHPKKEDAKARGNNGAKHDPHNELQYEKEFINVYPSDVDPNDSDRYIVMEMLQRTQLVYTPGHHSKRLYILLKVYDKKTGQIKCAKMPDSPLKGSIYGSSILSDLVVSKYGWHQSVTTIAARYRSEGFNANEGTLNGLMMKMSSSLFFRNLDRALYIAISGDNYLMLDESHLKVRTDSAKLDSEFIRKCYEWAMLGVNMSLVRYSCDNGSRSNEVGYSLVRPIDHQTTIQTDAYSCYKNIENREEFNLIQRIGCLQHTKRKFDGLEDPRAKKILEMFRSIYHLDTLRVEQARKDAIAGKEWTMEDHLCWRKNKMLPALIDILEFIKSMLDTAPEIGSKVSDTNAQPLSKALRNAIKYTLNESEALKRIFTCGIICDLDQGMIERANRVFSYFRKNSQMYGSMRAAENHGIYFSLIESARMHHLNLEEYMNFLLQQMATVEDGIVKNMESKDYELYRNMLPDRYAQTHKQQVLHYDPPAPPEGPLNPNSKRCGYKKHHGSKRTLSQNPDPDVG